MSEAVREITPEEFRSMTETGTPPVLIDVRAAWEHRICRIEGDELIPLEQLPYRLDELPKDRSVAFYCHHGMRSLIAAQIAARAGIEALSIAGGIELWAQQIEPTMARY
jgi:rhodanese-related sulfurtransferase